MATYLSGIYVATEFAVPLAKALSSLFVRGPAVDVVPTVMPVWTLGSAEADAATGSASGRGLLWGQGPEALGNLTTADHAARIAMLDPDDRLAYLADIGFSDDDVTSSAEIVDRWLDMSKLSLEEVAGKAFGAGEGLDWIMDEWHGTGSYEELGVLIQESCIPQAEPLLCYAVCSATELALSMLLLLQIDHGAEPVSGDTEIDWAAEDEHIASLGLIDEVSQWPE